jgi:hypothetical protein
MRNLALLVLIGLATPACWLQNSDDAPDQLTCGAPVSFTIDVGASIDHTAGIDAGYYASYNTGGNWHLEWTCDTKLSAEGCNFTGTITAPATSTATCYECESDDILTANQGDIEFNTITSTGIDGVDIVTPPGSSILVDLQINGIYQDDLVFLPSLGETQSPACMPITLVPSAP